MIGELTISVFVAVVPITCETAIAVISVVAPATIISTSVFPRRRSPVAHALGSVLPVATHVHATSPFVIFGIGCHFNANPSVFDCLK